MAIVSLNGSRIMTGLAEFPPVLADPGEGGGEISAAAGGVISSSSRGAAAGGVSKDGGNAGLFTLRGACCVRSSG